MASIEQVKSRISEIAQRPTNVTLSEIEWVMNQLQQSGFQVRRRKTTHGILYGVNSVRFSICPHHSGSRQLKPRYVEEFAKAMVELGLYEK
jgi:predicted RNA binding protein YcfA (HicA-like mRNA interferase family)